ncbi:MAG: Nif3-like dinuclear metal center hexameric protein, partial [Desulfobulbaceae bacterium]|nr:Nif3-like dinuclear metal center hexameric protein [Desulfobulbaceae bacterium]
MEVPLFICLGIMPPTVQDILEIIETIAPASLAEEWDNVGLMIGNPSDQVHSILIGLDPTLQLLDEADALGSNLVITHHPIIFHPLKAVRLEQPDGRFINRAIRKNINVISCHTNLDSAITGVSDSLADILGLIDTEPLVAQDSDTLQAGIGRIGNFPEPVSAGDFISQFKAACHPSWLLEAGLRPEKISRVAVCGGSCSELAETAMHSGAQVFVTAEVKHSVA